MNKLEFSQDEQHLAITWSCNGKTEYFKFVEMTEHNTASCSLCALNRSGECGLFPKPHCSFGFRKDGKEGNFIQSDVNEHLKAIRILRESEDFDPELLETILG